MANKYKIENIDKALLEACYGRMLHIDKGTETLEDLDMRRILRGYWNNLEFFRGGLDGYFPNGKLKETRKKELFERMEEPCKKFKTTFDISTPENEKFMVTLLESRAKELIKLIDEYLQEAKQKEKDTEAYLDKALAKLKECKTLKTFDQLAKSYGCGAGGFGHSEYNDFLRLGRFYMDPKSYANYIEKVAALRKGIAENDFLADKDITLYRRTDFKALGSLFAQCHCIPKNFFDWRKELSPDYCKLAEILNKKKPIISDPAFLSTSKSPSGTQGFGDNELIIKVKKGTAIGADITKFSGHPDQEEVLLVPSQKLKVINAIAEDEYGPLGHITINLETIK